MQHKFSMRIVEMRKGHSRKMRKTRGTRRGDRMRRLFRGGGPASVSDTSMNGPSKLSLAQGGEYQSIHSNQHGGMAPVGYTGMLDDSLRATARVGVLDSSLAAVRGMSDQGGGGRRRFRNKAYKMALTKMLKSLRGKKKTFRRRQRGGSQFSLSQAQDYSAPGMLLSPSAEARALGGMNPEWKLASDPTAFVPNRI
jgi:hypothetical protein